jgi:hypothetical protein
MQFLETENYKARAQDIIRLGATHADGVVLLVRIFEIVVLEYIGGGAQQAKTDAG